MRRAWCRPTRPRHPHHRRVSRHHRRYHHLCRAADHRQVYVLCRGTTGCVGSRASEAGVHRPHCGTGRAACYHPPHRRVSRHHLFSSRTQCRILRRRRRAPVIMRCCTYASPGGGRSSCRSIQVRGSAVARRGYLWNAIGAPCIASGSRGSGGRRSMRTSGVAVAQRVHRVVHHTRTFRHRRASGHQHRSSRCLRHVHTYVPQPRDRGVH